MGINLDPKIASDERLNRYESFLENFDLGALASCSLEINLDPKIASDERLSRYESFLENFHLGPWDSSKELGSKMVFLGSLGFQLVVPGFMKVPFLPLGFMLS